MGIADKLPNEWIDKWWDSHGKYAAIAYSFIYHLTKNEKYRLKEHEATINDSWVNLYDAYDSILSTIINEYDLVNFLYIKKDSGLYKFLPNHKDPYTNVKTLEERRIEKCNNIKTLLILEKIDLSTIVKDHFKKPSLIRSIIGKSPEDVESLSKHQIAIYFKQKIINAIRENEELLKKFNLDDQLMLALLEIYNIILITIKHDGFSTQINLQSGGIRQKKQLEQLLVNNSGKTLRNGCIYAGYTESDRKWYVGQTIFAPEKRFLEHRVKKTGPFRTGSETVIWSILESNIEANLLNEREAYWIDKKNAYTEGHNRTKGNS